MGLRYMSRHPTLWPYGIVPVLLNLLITTLLLAVGVRTSLRPRRCLGLSLLEHSIRVFPATARTCPNSERCVEY